MLFRSAFLESLCDTLYDSLRPRILHEPRLSSLCELCAVLNAMMALDSSPAAPTPLLTADARGDNDDDDDDATGPAGLRFSILVQSILQDAQTRLVFRAQAVVQSEVLHYVPSEDDLAWPEKLARGGAAAAARGTLWEDEDADAGEVERRGSGVGGKGRFRVPKEGRMEGWYPTLRKTVWVLERLNAYVNVRGQGESETRSDLVLSARTGAAVAQFFPMSLTLTLAHFFAQDAIFQDFAAEAVTLCRQSLVTASLLIAARASPPSSSSDGANKAEAGDRRADGFLFLIRHLLLLKEMVRSVDLRHVERAADWSSVTGASFAAAQRTPRTSYRRVTR